MADSKEKTTKPQEPRRQSEDSPERALTIEIDKNFENSKDEVTKKLEEDVKKPALKEQFAKVYERTRERERSGGTLPNTLKHSGHTFENLSDEEEVRRLIATSANTINTEN